MKPAELAPVGVATVLWTTALVSIFTEQIAWVWALLLWAGSIGATAWLWRGKSRTAGGVAVLLALAGCVASTVAFAAPARAELREHDGRAVELIVDVVSMLREGRDGRLWFDADTVAAGIPGQPDVASGRVRVGVEVPTGGAPTEWTVGARLKVIGLAKSGGAGERAALVVFGRGGVEQVRAPALVFEVAGAVREQFVARSTKLPEPGAGLLPGLAVGDTRAVSEELNNAMLVTGLSHLTAVSGANCAVVVGVVFWVVALCRGGRRLRVTLAAIALVAFVILVTAEPSVVRAATMAGLAMFALLLGRVGAGAGILSLAVAVILIGEPWLAATPGFALSAAATGALLLLARPVSRGLSRFMPAPLALGVAVPLSAQIVCAPIIALFAEQQTIVGVFANIIAAPAAPIATVVGLLACLAMPIPLLADIFAASAWLPSAWVAATALISAQLPGAYVLVAPGLIPALLVALIAVAVTVLLVRGRRGTPPPLVMRQGATVIIAISLGVSGAKLLMDGSFAVLETPDSWSVAVCDVGQGDAIVLRSEGRIMLVDTGPEPKPLASCLRALGIGYVDILLITHFDVDHYGGSSELLGRVATLMHGPPGEGVGKRIVAEFAASGTKTVEVATGVTGTLGQASVKVHWPLRDSPIFPPGNDSSVVIEVSGGGIPRTLLLGDLSAFAQRQLLATGRIRGEFAVVKVAHHGSRDQEPELYRLADASVALFAVGENTYGHPHPFALALAASAPALRSDTHGLILLGLHSGGLSVWTER